MSKLIEHINSNYLEASHHLKAKNAPRKIIAYVESFDDVFFWRSILSMIETKDRYFEIMLPTNEHAGTKVLGRGKRSVLKTIMRNTGRNMIACIDADYDYMLQGKSESSALMLNTPFVFHTYAYAIENLQCYSGTLHHISVATTMNDKRIFDYDAYLTAFSIVVHPLFIWSIWLYRTGNYKHMSITDFDNVITPGHFTIENTDAIIGRIQRRVRQKVQTLRSIFPTNDKALRKLNEELQQLGVTPDNTYLYIHGHHLMDKVVMPMMTFVTRRLRKLRESEIQRQAVHLIQRSNEMACYNNSMIDLESAIRKNTMFTNSPIVKRIANDISTALDSESKA